MDFCRQIQAICKYCCCREGNAESFYGGRSRKNLPQEKTPAHFLLDSIKQQDSNKKVHFKNWPQSLSISSSQFLQKYGHLRAGPKTVPQVGQIDKNLVKVFYGTE